MTRSYESNGPDVKIRGNAQHVAEKYLQLARDAHTGGDPVAAENYLQHAEHYFRIIAAAQAAQAMAQSGQTRPAGEGDAEDDDDDDYSALTDRFASPAERALAFQPQQGAFPVQPSAPNAPQPFVERPQFEGDRQQGQSDRGGFQPRQDRQGNRFQDRGPRQDRPFNDRGEGYRDNRQNRDGRPRASSVPTGTPGRRRRRPAKARPRWSAPPRCPRSSPGLRGRPSSSPTRRSRRSPRFRPPRSRRPRSSRRLLSMKGLRANPVFRRAVAVAACGRRTGSTPRSRTRISRADPPNPMSDDTPVNE